MGNKASQAQKPPQSGRGAQKSVTSPDNVQVQGLDDKEASSDATPVLDIPFTCSLGGGNGWPSEVTVVLYHQTMGVLVVGTESGTVYAYGDGFQFMQANVALLDITNIVEFSTDKIIVTFADNSLAVLTLPSLTLVTRLDNWLGESCGDITSVYSSYILSQNYFFVGTSEGFVRVLEIDIDEGQTQTIRECDYVITSANAGVSSKMVISSIQLCPKDEKYLAISYDGPSSTKSTGVTVIYDLAKKKVHRSYKSAGVTTLAWNHVGDILYAGTRSGEVLALGLEKNSCLTVWNVKSEIIEGDDDEGDEEDKATSVRKMIWMGPQRPNDAGCLFVLIGSFGSDTEHLKSVLVALTPNLLQSSIELEQILSVPPILGVEVVGFRVVSTLDHSDDSDGTESGVPGLLMLGQSESGDGEGVVRELLLLKCPDSLVTEWSMELGLLPEPRPAMEVLPGKKPISCMKGIGPNPSEDSISFKLLQMLHGDDSDEATTSRFVRMRAKTHTAEASLSDEISKAKPVEDKRGQLGGGRRRSTRDFFSDINTAILQMETMAEGAVESWALTLATAVEDPALCLDMDIVFIGHTDGSIVVWATSLPAERTDTSGCGNTWIPLCAMKCGTQEITCIEVSEMHQVVAVGDSAGTVSLWQIPETSSSGFKRLFSALLDSRVSSLALSADGTSLVAGSEVGSLYEVKDWSRQEMVKIQSVEQIGASGAIMKTLIAPYWKGTAYSFAIYVIYKAGQYGVVDLHTHQLLSYCSASSNPVDLSEGHHSDDEDNSCDGTPQVDADQLVYACVMNGNGEIVNAMPQLETVTEEDCDDDNDAGSPNTTPVKEESTSTPMVKKKSGFFQKGNTPPPSSNVTPPRALASAWPDAAPRYLLFLRGRYLVTCDLKKFALPDRSSTPVFSAPQRNAVTMQCISEEVGDGPFVAAQDISIIEDSTRFWSQPIPCLSTIDSEGNLKILSLPSGKVMSSCPVLPQVFSEEFVIRSSTILPNGDAYLSTSNYMVYSSTPENKAYPQTTPVPCRATTGFSVPPKSQMLQMIIGDKDAASHMKTKTDKKDKRRGSVMSFAMSGPVDFQKLFSKSLDARRKEELFGAANNKFDEEEEEDDEVAISSAQKDTQSKAAGTKAALDETRQAFEERGERLNRLNKKMEDFGESAKLYKKNSAAHKERMRKKNERWGLF